MRWCFYECRASTAARSRAFGFLVDTESGQCLLTLAALYGAGTALRIDDAFRDAVRHHNRGRARLRRALGQDEDGGVQGEGAFILHSDRGRQFRSGDYLRFLEHNTLICSMKAVGYCGDSAAYEDFLGLLQTGRIG